MNDGTPFEPCTAHTELELTAIGINPQSIRDAATIDNDLLRGCHWRNPDDTADFAQFVWNDSAPIDRYKRGQAHRRWLPDRQIHGRTVAIGVTDRLCGAVFNSLGAKIASDVSSISKSRPSPGLTVECDGAIALATLAAAKAP